MRFLCLIFKYIFKRAIMVNAHQRLVRHRSDTRKVDRPYLCPKIAVIIALECQRVLVQTKGCVLDVCLP